MDPETAGVVNTAVQVAGTLLAVALGFIGGLVTERSRRAWDEKHRYADTKRELYARFITTARSGLPRLHEKLTRADVEAVQGLMGALYAQLSEISLMAPQDVIDAVSDLVIDEIQACRNATANPISEDELKRLGERIAQVTDLMRGDLNTGRAA